MRRVLGVALASIALLAVLAGPAAATTTQVDCGTGADLQAAIDAASPGDTLLISGTCVGNFSALKLLNFTGQGIAPTLAGGSTSTDPVLELGAGAISMLTISGGRGDGLYNAGGSVTLSDSTVSGNAGIGVDLDGPIVVTNSVVSGNGVYGIAAGKHWGPPADIRNSVVRDNAGTGIYNRGTMTIVDSVVAGNGGRGIWNESSLSGRGVLTVTRSTITGNDGGGVLNHWQASIVDSRIMNNSTAGPGGGIANLNEGIMLNFRGVISVTNTKVMNNTASDGGGIYNSGPPDVVTLDGVKMKNNTPNNCTGC